MASNLKLLKKDHDLVVNINALPTIGTPTLMGGPRTITCNNGNTITCPSGTRWCYDNSPYYCGTSSPTPSTIPYIPYIIPLPNQDSTVSPTPCSCPTPPPSKVCNTEHEIPTHVSFSIMNTTSDTSTEATSYSTYTGDCEILNDKLVCTFNTFCKAT